MKDFKKLKINILHARRNNQCSPKSSARSFTLRFEIMILTIFTSRAAIGAGWATETIETCLTTLKLFFY
uniref:Uncharacterized protein n=1 Tax=Meloidogyne enterolobii TaxID=390850 RepID=A0A6V7UD44_MELEN|nr:unnamed protein product [Meloidogyne enterolobii]